MDWEKIRQEEKHESAAIVVVYAWNNGELPKIMAVEIEKCKQIQDIF